MAHAMRHVCLFLLIIIFSPFVNGAENNTLPDSILMSDAEFSEWKKHTQPIEVRENGNFVLANRIGRQAESIALFEITPKKKMVRTFKRGGTASLLSIPN